MTNSMSTLQQEISRLIVESLNLEDVDPHQLDPKAPLFEKGLGLDSIDALEIGAAISKRYGIKLKSQSEETEQHFNSIESLAMFVDGAIREQANPSGE